MKHRIKVTLLAITISFCSLSTFSELRTLTGRNGSCVEAELISHDANEVKLKRGNGKTISVEIDKLSIEDQKYLSQKTTGPVQREKEQYFALKLELTSESGMAAVNILPPWKSRVIVKERTCPIYDEIQRDRRKRNQPPMTTVAIDDFSITWKDYDPDSVNYELTYNKFILKTIIYLPSYTKEDFTFELDKSPAGVVNLTVYSLDPKTQKTTRLRSFRNSGDRKKDYKIPYIKIQSKCVFFDYSEDS